VPHRDEASTVILLHTGLPVRSLLVSCILPRVNVHSQPFKQEPAFATLHGTYRRSGTVVRLPFCSLLTCFLTCFHLNMPGLQDALIRRVCWRLRWRINCRSRLQAVLAVKMLVCGPVPDRCSVYGVGIHEPRQPVTVTDLCHVSHCPQ
jgi:hypothetical protein